MEDHIKGKFANNVTLDSISSQNQDGYHDDRLSFRLSTMCSQIVPEHHGSIILEPRESILESYDVMGAIVDAR